MPTEKRTRKMINVLKNRQRDLTVVFENIHDPHNVSAVLRTCDAIGIDRVHLMYTDESFPALGEKTSASAKKWIRISRHRSYPELKKVLKNSNMTIYVTSIAPNSRNIYEIDWTQPAAVIFGNEHRGVSGSVKEIADEHIKIPMFGMIESLNVSVAAAIILYEICRQRVKKHLYPFSKTDEEWFLERLSKWTGTNIKTINQKSMK